MTLLRHVTATPSLRRAARVPLAWTTTLPNFAIGVIYLYARLGMLAKPGHCQYMLTSTADANLSSLYRPCYGSVGGIHVARMATRRFNSKAAWPRGRGHLLARHKEHQESHRWPQLAGHCRRQRGVAPLCWPVWMRSTRAMP